MAVSGRGKRTRHLLGRRREKTPTQELAARLAPPEETEAAERLHQAVPGEGRGADDTIRVSTSDVKLADKFSEEDRRGARIFYLEPVVVFILVLLLAFVAFIAWQVSQMPPAAK